ncbi:MAG: metallophosphoesterase [Phycisphaeraceae bacterium]
MTQNPGSSAPPPGSDLNLENPEVAIDLLQRGATAMLNHRRRAGSVVDLPTRGRVLMTGDLHDHGLNLQRIIQLAALHESRANHLILHEIIHGPARVNDRDLSVRTLLRIAALLLEYPGQVLLMMGNHELAQYGGEGIIKAGSSVVESFDAGLEFLYHERHEDVRAALHGFIAAMLLAVRCPNGVFCSHSLPGPRKLEKFDPSVIDRVPTPDDLAMGGSAYLLVWGRRHTQKLADELAAAWKTKLFVMGHQPTEMGYELEGETMLVLNSDHEHGVALPIDLGREYTRDELVEAIVPLNSVVL